MNREPQGAYRFAADDSELVETINLSIEMELEGMGTALCGRTYDNLEDAFRSYETNVRSVVNSFALRLFRTRLADINPMQNRWPGTPFPAFRVLAYLGRIRWQDGKLAEATECYQLLLDFDIFKQSTDWTNDVKMRLAEFENEVPFERRSKACVGWL